MNENSDYAAPIDNPRDASTIVALLEEIRDRLDHNNDLLDEISRKMGQNGAE